VGDRDGRVRVHRRHVSLLRRSSGDRSTFAGRCLHFRLPPAAGGVAGWPDEVAGENLARAFVEETETGAGRETRGSIIMIREEAFALLNKSFGEKIHGKTEFRDETTYTIEANDLREIAKFCRDDLSFDYLLDITSIDNLEEEPRFEIVYELYSMPHAAHLRLKLRISEGVGEVDTISDIWPTANWHEREIYDMMGIKFKGHPDLRRILMWDGYPYFPLRKDFPLEGLPSEMPDVAFTKVTSMEGGPFVTRPSTATAKDREPRARPPQL
jgi:NADH-quinone oxidoreductase subunit C